MAKPTDVTQFIGDLKGGIAEKQLGLFLSEVAAAVVENNGVGKVTVVLDIKRISDSSQVEIAHTLSYKAPTITGEKTEVAKGKTPMYVLNGGGISIMPERQDQYLNDPA